MEAVETLLLLYQTARRHILEFFSCFTCHVEFCFFFGLNITYGELLICWPPRIPDFRLGRRDIPCLLSPLSIPFHELKYLEETRSQGYTCFPEPVHY
jgi:hypothetical protein